MSKRITPKKNMESAQRIRAILSFVQTADHGSFAAAARNLNISAAAVSKNVASLEQALGVRLINRTTRTLSLTTEGFTFLSQARVALDALGAAVDSVSAPDLQLRGRVRISSSAAFGNSHLIPILPKLLAQHPALSIEVDFDDRRIDLVREGYDLALRGGQIADSALVSRPVCHLHKVLVATPAYMTQHGVPRLPNELTQHQLIVRRFLGGEISPWTFRATDESMSIYEPDMPTLTLSAPEAILSATLAGIGIAEVALYLAWPHLRSGTLKIVLPNDHHPGSYEMTLQYPHRALLAPRVRTTVDYLLQAFAEDEALHVSLDSLSGYAVA